ncbi:MAG: Fe-S cluster assembly protein SufD [Acidobacteria bacterium]|nr:Fe-S cluster assembly protein SufD [Acidobacteriota bacterium]MBK9528244.1 Fe-S cluster assembly protein SufD [Acidobacteriota bacterium]MBP9110029.1 Fe-S cluster assembly protein SufD [Pyrinomonadaceae bacterium]
MVSTTAVMETSFSESFREFIAKETDPAIRTLRENAFAEFTAAGFPTPKLEDWKYTNAAPLVSGQWSVTGGQIEDVADPDLELLRRFGSDRNGFAALNSAFADLKVIRIAKETSIAEPIELAFAADENTAIFPHILVIAETGSKATIVESYDSTAKSFTNTAIQIIVEDNASLTHYRVQRDSPEAFHYGVTEVSLGSGSSYDSTNINLGGRLSRHDIDVKFTAEGGEAWVDGLYMLNGEQHSDTHSIIDHTVPNCKSHQNYKGVLNDNSRGVFNGKVFVRENAHGTDAQQSNKNLLLSNDARVDTKPQLEIFNDDVKCAHGATVGQLEEEELFYLLTRGLPEVLAKNLLTYGFAEEIINKIKIESIKKDLDVAVLNRLGAEI